MRRLQFIGRSAAILGMATGLVGISRAAPGGLPTNIGHADSSPEWEALREKLFGSRTLRTAADQGQVRLLVPLRAAYGASVPVKVVSQRPQTPELNVRRTWLVVDKNPSKLAARIDIGPAMARADFETRLRVDEYSHVRVVQEWSDGEFHTDSRYVKVSGGCSAPPNRDQLHNIGKTAFRLPDGVHFGEATTADVQVVHPNDTGFELNHITVMFIPPHFVRTLNVSYAGERVFDAELDFSISENPGLRFNFVPKGEGELRAEVEDTKEGRYVGTLAVRGPASTAGLPGATS